MVNQSLSLKWALCAMALTLLPLGAFAQETSESEAAAAPMEEPALEEDYSDEGGLPFSFSVDNTFASMYVWRGIRFVDDWVWQPSVTAGLNFGENASLSFNVWGDYPLEHDTSGDFDEIDYTVDFTTSIDIVSISVGGILYYFPNTGGSDTVELYASLGFDVPLAPYITWYHDVDEADGAYIQAGIGHSFTFVEDGPLTFGMDLGATIAWASSNWAEFNYGVDDSGLADGTLSVGFPVGLGDYVSVTPGVTYAVLLDSDVRDEFDGTEDSLYFSVTLSIGI